MVERESWPYLALAFSAALIATYAMGPGVLTALCWLLAAWAFFVFRDQPRPVPVVPGAILSPADGRIIKIERARDPYANRDALKISVIMSLFNVHTNRASVDGVIRHVHYFPGRWVNVDLNAASPGNERNALVIESQGHIVTLAQVAGLVARRILCYVKPGDTVMRGQRFGFIRFGSRVDVYLPTDAVVNVAPGDKVHATTSILATLPKV